MKRSVHMKTNKLNNNWIHAKVTLHLSFMLLYFFFKKYERLLFSNEFLHQFCRIQFIFLSIFINIFFRDKFKNNKNRNRCAGSDRNQYLIWNERPFNKSSHRRCSVRKDVLRNLDKFTRKHLYQSLFFNKVAGLRPACFPVNFAKFLRTAFLQNTSRRLLLFQSFIAPQIIYI